MTEHPITPSRELVQQWVDAYFGGTVAQTNFHLDLANRAAQWGADQELEACCQWMTCMGYWGDDGKAIPALRAARRPKPPRPSLKEQALDELHISFDRGYLKEGAADTIRRALEQLDD
jgi:hypothetical protein